MTSTVAAPVSDTPQTAEEPFIDLRHVARSFKDKVVLRDVTLTVPAGRIHALIGPNGAGKTTLLRILCGLTTPTTGSARLMGRPSVELAKPANRHLVGFAPSGDRTAYLRLSGRENLVFFGRLHGLRKREARQRAAQVLEDVGLAHAADVQAGVYSHGMQQRLAVARALLMTPSVLLVDEATHDLDPAGARAIRHLVSVLARRGTAVLWTTQRIEEINGFADTVSVLQHGTLSFTGSVVELVALCGDRHYLLQVAAPGFDMAGILDRGARVLTGAHLRPPPRGGDGQLILSLEPGSVLGRQLGALGSEGIEVLSCVQHGSAVESAFLALTAQDEVRS